jgi:hypothetical protein
MDMEPPSDARENKRREDLSRERAGLERAGRAASTPLRVLAGTLLKSGGDYSIQRFQMGMHLSWTGTRDWQTRGNKTAIGLLTGAKKWDRVRASG